ncbi:Slr1614 protein [Candidatus Moduliflexus flocculans]|uniref:Slr1614 protein n=1 Tax=Candidatus Moduliflexus flocculans TaxID=1499966 RepID=A0A0S6VTS1_9BACT|nr:Slr1614 protein [Candidatus Moduliflexus flocculans]
MFLHITAVTYLHEYQIDVLFNNGRRGVVDLRCELNGKMFEPLRELPLFAQVAIDPELETVVWPNGADFAPEFLYYLAFRDDPALQEQFQRWGYCAAPVEPRQTERRAPKRQKKPSARRVPVA